MLFLHVVHNSKHHLAKHLSFEKEAHVKCLSNGRFPNLYNELLVYQFATFMSQTFGDD